MDGEVEDIGLRRRADVSTPLGASQIFARCHQAGVSRAPGCLRRQDAAESCRRRDRQTGSRLFGGCIGDIALETRRQCGGTLPAAVEEQLLDAQGAVEVTDRRSYRARATPTAFPSIAAAASGCIRTTVSRSSSSSPHR